MEIRKVKISDFEECIKLLQDENLEGINGEYFKLEWLYDYLEDGLFLVAEEDDKIIGVAFGEYLKTDGVMLWMITVEKNHRNKGIGKLLLKEFENMCIERKRTWIILYATDDENTIKFYKKNNYGFGKKCIEAKKNF